MNYLKSFFCALVMTCSSALCFAADVVHVVIKAPFNTPTTSSMQVVGERFDPVILKLENHLTFVADVTVSEEASSLDFQINRGGPETDAIDQMGVTVKFSVPRADFGKPFVYSVINWRDLHPLGVVGNVQVWRNMYSPQLKNRRNISIYLPPNYDVNEGRRYPVIYMHDGQNVFDPLTSTTGVDWRIDDILNSEIIAGRFAPVIVVAIDCIRARRHEEFDYLRDGRAYGAFVIKTIKPLIDKKFRTYPDRDNTFLMGSSMGAFISFELLWAHPEIFSRAVGLSLPADTNNGSMQRFLKIAKKPKQRIDFYFDHGNYGDDQTYEKQDKPFLRDLLDKGFDPIHVVYDVDPFGNHREIDWARRSPEALKWLLTPLKSEFIK